MLTEKAVRAAGARDKPYKVADAGGLSLHAATTGYRAGRLKYRIGGKEQLLTLGAYPDFSLAEARELRNDSKKLLRAGQDPRHAAKRARLIGVSPDAETFEVVARRWHDRQLGRWKPVHAVDVITSLERDIFPYLGNMPLAEIDKRTLVAVLRKIEARGAIETARRVKQRVAKVYQFANAEGGDFTNPAADINEALTPVPLAKRYPALLALGAICNLLSDVDRSGSSPITRLSSRFMALTAQRPGMVRTMEWPEIKNVEWGDPDSDVSAANWIVPADKIKQELHLRSDEEFDHTVPLSWQAVDALRAVRLLTGRCKYVFPIGRAGCRRARIRSAISTTAKATRAVTCRMAGDRASRRS